VNSLLLDILSRTVQDGRNSGPSIGSYLISSHRTLYHTQSDRCACAGAGARARARRIAHTHTHTHTHSHARVIEKRDKVRTLRPGPVNYPRGCENASHSGRRGDSPRPDGARRSPDGTGRWGGGRGRREADLDLPLVRGEVSRRSRHCVIRVKLAPIRCTGARARAREFLATLCRILPGNR